MASVQQRSATHPGIYERLLQRLALALDEADSLRGFSADAPRELELRDLSWLRGWHAAAEELASLNQAADSDQQSTTASAASASTRLTLCCAVCGEAADWSPGLGVLACSVCGAQLFRARSPR
jgi:hypothetical protein